MKKIVFTFTLLASALCLAAGAAGGHSEHGSAIPLDKIGWQAANLGALLLVIFFLIKASIKEVFKNRQKNFLEQSEKTKSSLAQAEATLLETRNKLKKLESEESTSIDKAGHEAQSLKNNLIKESENTAAKMLLDSKLIINAEIEKAKNEISLEILSKAIYSTTKKISDNGSQLTRDSESEFLKQIDQVK